jgi:methionine--tRNA ligase beta chain
MNDIINYADFQKLDIRMGTVISCERVEGSEKLLCIMLDVGEETPRQILSGIAKWFNPEDLVGKQVPVIINLEPRKMMGLESQGMILMADNMLEESVSLLHPQNKVPNGSVVR